MKLVVIKKEEFKSIYEKMTTSFASDEIRTLEDAYKILDVKEYKVFHLTLNNNNIGFITIWNLDTCTFVEHFVIYEEYRNKGFGGIAIDLINKEFNNVVLEAELGTTDLSKRRLGFYSRHGFKINDVYYIQPAYHNDKQPVDMHLLSYPDKLANINKVIKEIYKVVYGVI
jgi:GNAT superfamily N-acetyltransferase